MKKLAIITAAFAATSAVAADLPSRKAPPAFVEAPPIMSWDSPYVGVVLGGFWGNNGSTIATNGGTTCAQPSWSFGKEVKSISKEEPALGSINPCAGGRHFYPHAFKHGNGFPAPYDPAVGAWTQMAAASGNVGVSQSGFMGGLTAGFNHQMGGTGRLVLGAETDLSGVAGSGGTGSVGTLATDGVYNYVGQIDSTRRLRYFGTLRARLGYLVMPNLMLYATGGFAYGGLSSHTTISGGGAPALNPYLAPVMWHGRHDDSNRVSIGWTVGAGGEYRINPAWGVKLEYLHYDLGRRTYVVPVVGTNWAGGTVVSGHTRGDLVRAGVNYYFTGL